MKKALQIDQFDSAQLVFHWRCGKMTHIGGRLMEDGDAGDRATLFARAPSFHWLLQPGNLVASKPQISARADIRRRLICNASGCFHLFPGTAAQRQQPQQQQRQQLHSNSSSSGSGCSSGGNSGCRSSNTGSIVSSSGSISSTSGVRV